VDDQAGALVCRLPLPQGPGAGRPFGLEVRVHLGRTSGPSGPATEVLVEALAEAAAEQGHLPELLAPLLAESVRAALRYSPHGRLQERVAWPHALHVCLVDRDGCLGEPIECLGKDISPGGIGFYLPGELPSARLSLHLPETAQTQARVVAARVVRVQGCGEPWYEVGAVLLPESADPTV
jgi:hypothetical protein